jgi:uncharacterized protein (TIGR03437 family)
LASGVAASSAGYPIGVVLDPAGSLCSQQHRSWANAASQLGGFVAPGELIQLSGRNLPANPDVEFDGIPAPVIYSDSNTITTAVPFEVGSTLTVLTVACVGGYNLSVWPYAPGLFTADGSGKGQLEALNQDGTINSDSNPALAGSTVTVYMTGAGAMSPAIPAGEIAPQGPPFSVPILYIQAFVNGTDAETGAVQAPGMIDGVVQAEFMVPPNTPSGDVSVELYVGVGDGILTTTTTQPTTIAVQQPYASPNSNAGRSHQSTAPRAPVRP